MVPPRTPRALGSLITMPFDWHPLWLSVQVAALATLWAAVLGIALAAWLAQRKSLLRDVIEVLVTAPMVLPPTVLGYYALVAFGVRSPVGQVWQALTGGPLVFSRAGAVLAATLGALPLVVRAARASLQAVDPTVVAAARTLGAGPLRVLWQVQLPLAAGGVFAGISLGFARALGDFGVTLMLAGNIEGLTRTAPLAIYDAVQAGREAEAAGLSLVLTALAIALLFGIGRLSRRVLQGG